MAGVLVAVILGAAAVYILLPRARGGMPRLLGLSVATASILWTAAALVHARAVTAESVLFYGFSIIAVVAAGTMVTHRNPVHAALSFVLVILSTCGLFLLLAAPFLMAATIIVYAGAIVVTFLFLIMLAQQAGLSGTDAHSREPLLSVIAGFVLLGATLYLLGPGRDDTTLPGAAEPVASGTATKQENVAPLGQTLFTSYLIPVELAGMLLLVATVGSVAIAGRHLEGGRP